MTQISNMPLGASNDPDAPFNRPDDDGIRICPECNSDISGIIVDEIKDCADHLTHEELIEDYRWLKGEHKRLQEKSLYFIRGTLAEKLMADLKEANESRRKLGAERYLLEKRVEELESRCRYWKATAKEFGEALRTSTEVGKELLKAIGGESGK